MSQQILLSQMEVGQSGKIVRFLCGMHEIGALMQKGIRIGAHINKTHEPYPGAPITVMVGYQYLPIDQKLASKVVLQLDTGENN